MAVVDRARDGTPILLRSSQPDAEDLVAWHRQYGVRTVVNLRGPNEKKDWFAEEREGVRSIGARWIQLRVSGSKAPGPEVIEAFFEIVEDPANWPVLIHCHGGIHRTGLMAALYRIQYMGWDAERAVAELESYGFDWTTRDRSALKRFLRSYVPDPSRTIDRAARGVGEAPCPPAPPPAASLGAVLAPRVGDR